MPPKPRVGGRGVGRGRGSADRRPTPNVDSAVRSRLSLTDHPCPSMVQSDTPAIVTDDVSQDNPALCGTCKLVVGNEAIGCDQCDGWYHPGSMCMGLPDSLISDIVRLQGGGIKFVCLTCRLSPGGTNSPSTNSLSTPRSRTPGQTSSLAQNSTFKQMSEMVMALCSTVARLSNQIAELQQSVTVLTQTQTQRPVSFSPTANAPPSPDSLRLTIQEEIIEMREREKRYKSVILRGLLRNTTEQVCQKVKEISLVLIQKEVILENVSCINNERGIFRGTINNDEDRKAIILQAKHLKQTSDFSTIYIHKDLTYKQRQAFFSKRNAQRSNTAVPGSSSSAVVDASQAQTVTSNVLTQGAVSAHVPSGSDVSSRVIPALVASGPAVTSRVVSSPAALSTTTLNTQQGT